MFLVLISEKLKITARSDTCQLAILLAKKKDRPGPSSLLNGLAAPWSRHRDLFLTLLRATGTVNDKREGHQQDVAKSTWSGERRHLAVRESAQSAVPQREPAVSSCGTVLRKDRE